MLQSKASRAHFDAKSAELDYRERLSELVEAEQVGKEAFEMAKLLRDNFLQLPDRLAPMLTASTNETEVHKLLLNGITEILDIVSSS